MTPNPVPVITAEELAQKLKSSDQFIVLDVREHWEVNQARISDPRVVVRPMSQLSKEGLSALPQSAQSPDAVIYVLCHHGVRSANVTSWLVAGGWKKAFSISGGLDEYARTVDRSIGLY